MNLHRLRVINFDRSSSEKNAPMQNPSTIKHTNGVINKNPAASHQIIRNNTTEECGDCNECSEKRIVFNQTRNSITLNGPLKSNKSKKYLRNNASFISLKKENTWKNKNNHSAIFPHSFERPFKSSSGRLKNKKYTTKKTYENLGTDNEIQVLFTNQTFKTSKTPAKCRNKRRITRKRSKSIYDIFDFQTNDCLFDRRCDYNKSRNINFRQKKTVRWKTSKKLFICCRKFLRNEEEKPSSLRNIRAVSSNRFNVQKNSIINFSNSNDETLNNKSPIKTHCNEILNSKFGCNDPQVSVTSPCLQTLKCLEDAVASTSKFFNVKSPYKISHSNPDNLKRSHEKNSESNTTETNQRLNVISKVLPLTITAPNFFLTHGESIVKTILIGFIFIAWLPCIIMILTCWILTYPLRPHSTVTDVILSIQELYISTSYSCRTSVNSVFNFIKRILRKAFCSGKDMVKSNQSYGKRTLHRQAPHQYSCNLRSKRKHPNPTRKYTLFYTKNMGWLMKPIPHRLVDKRTYIAQTLRHLFRQDSKEKNKYRIKKTILKNHGSHNECRCLYPTKKVKIHMPTENAENMPHSSQNQNHTIQTQVQKTNFTRGAQYLPLKTINKSSEYHHQPRSLSYNQSFKQHSPLEKHLPSNSSSLQNGYKHSHQHTLTVTRPPQNYFQRIDHLSSANVKSVKDHSLEPQISQPSHHNVLLHSSRMHRPILSSTNPLSSKFTNSCRRCLHDEHCRALKVCNRHIRNSLHARDNSIPTKIISVCKNTPCNKLDPCILNFLKSYANNRRNKKYSKIKQKIYCLCKQSCRKLNAIAADADEQVWCGDDQCNFYNVKSKKGSRNKIFRCCSSSFSKLYKCNRNICYVLLYLISVCVWCPIFCCTYICYETIYQCTRY